MVVATTYARAELGVDAPLVCVEADVSPGLPQVQIVGLPQTAVRESKDRVKAAIVSSGFEFPSRRVTVNLAPADLPKAGGRFDLAIAVAILAASEKLPLADLSHTEWLGELSLTGQLRGVGGVLPAALKNRNTARRLIVPLDNRSEAALSESESLFVADSLGEVAASLTQGTALAKADKSHAAELVIPEPLRLSDIKGQDGPKRALVIAAAGGHNLLMIGPPGTGKTMLAMRLPGLIPPMSLPESLEVASVASVSRQAFDPASWGIRPFRTPHHTASAAAMVGGSNPPRPGEISLAHHGVLFLDELPEYPRTVLEVLREPLESGEIWISRASSQVRYPARFQLLAAMNPCPCGYYGDERRDCECPPDRILRYRGRLSGPLLDRIDLHVEVPPLPAGALADEASAVQREGREDDDARAGVVAARERMLARQQVLNSRLNGPAVGEICRLSSADRQLLDDSVTRLGLSTRGYFKILKIARSIADLEDSRDIRTNHLIEALGYRRLDRKSWQQ